MMDGELKGGIDPRAVGRLTTSPSQAIPLSSLHPKRDNRDKREVEDGVDTSKRRQASALSA
jgi:hypothetical protein